MRLLNNRREQKRFAMSVIESEPLSVIASERSERGNPLHRLH